MDAQIIAFALEENACRIPQKSSRDIKNNMFSREIARMQEYDTGICPDRFRSALAYVRSNGWRSHEDTIEIMRCFGDRDFLSPVEELELIVDAYNSAARANKRLPKGTELNLEVPLEEGNESKEVLESLASKGIFMENEDHDDGEIYFSLPDKINGFSLLYGSGRFSNQNNRTLEVEIWGVPEQNAQGTDDYVMLFKLGTLDISEIPSFGARRFTHIFGVAPASYKDIKEALVQLNDLPSAERPGNNDKRYKILEREFPVLEAPDRVSICYVEATAAKEAGLFMDVQVYQLASLRQESRQLEDFVLVGQDHFGNKYPITYWQSEKAVEEESEDELDEESEEELDDDNEED